MALVNGSDCLLQVNVLGEYLSIACARSFSLSTTTETVETTTKSDGQWRSFAPFAFTYSLTFEGILKVDPLSTSGFDLQAAQLGFTEVPYRIIFEDEDGAIKIIEGTCIITSSTFNVNAGQFADFSFELQGTGAYQVRDSIETCETVINDGFLQIQLRQFPYATPGATTLEVTLSSISGAWQKINASIDGGTPLSFYNAQFYMTGISMGTHNIKLTPVCVNGIEGSSVTKTFEFS